MLCPNPACAILSPQPTLTLSERHGIEIDYCPHCRGVWLDRGELDKLIERATASIAPTPAPALPERQSWKEDKPWKDDKHHGYGHHPYYGKRKKSLLGEIFDF
jgi:Zn-finger nucleic acid-binding protein